MEMKNNNSLHQINVWREYGTWMFNDVSKGLHREPFVGTTNLLIDALCIKAGFSPFLFESEEDKLPILFSETFFPDSLVKFTRVHFDEMGQTYESPGGRQGWLCPAFLKYFGTPPKEFHVGVPTSYNVQLETEDV